MSIGGGKSSGKQKDPAASTLAQIAEGFATETKGLRQGLISQLTNILTNPSGQGGFDQAGYDAAMKQYETDLAAFNTAQKAAPATEAASGTPFILPQLRANPFFAARMEAQNPTSVPDGAAPAAPAAPTAPTREAFQRGGGIQVPIIAQAVEATRRAGSTAQRGTEEELARTNLTGTPFGQNILASGRREGELAASNVQTDIMKSLFNMIPNFALGQSQTALSGLSGAVGGNVSGKGKGFGAGASK